VEGLTVRDIMQPNVITIRPEATVRQLADLLATHKISGVPVVDAENQVIGIVSEADLIVRDADLHFPHYIQFLESVIYLQSVRKFEERYKKALAAKVADVMTTEVESTPPEASIYDVATQMSDHNVNRLPVIEGERLVGIVTRGDIVRAIAESKA
jgi:CBS domain-containing protein